jgi:hypothetical protein
VPPRSFGRVPGYFDHLTLDVTSRFSARIAMAVPERAVRTDLHVPQRARVWRSGTAHRFAARSSAHGFALVVCARICRSFVQTLATGARRSAVPLIGALRTKRSATPRRSDPSIAR